MVTKMYGDSNYLEQISQLLLLLQCNNFYAELSFLMKYYTLLYQAVIPNCTLTIAVLKKHIDISNWEESYIHSGISLRARCQRVINVLLVYLEKEDGILVKFCSLFNKISVLSDISNKLTTGSQ